MGAKRFRAEKAPRDKKGGPGKKDPHADKGRAHAHATAAPRGNVFTRFTLRSLAANRVRTAVTIAGVALATGLLMAVLASVTSLRAALVNQMRADGGVWQLAFDYTDDTTLDNLRTLAGDRLDRLAFERDLGAAALSNKTALTGGPYLAVLDLPREQGGTAHAAGDDAYDVLVLPEVDEGRLPERAGEICLPSYLRGVTLEEGATFLPGIESGATSASEIELGGEVTLALGRRVMTDGTGRTVASGSSLAGQYSYEGDGEGNYVITGAAETLADVGEPRTYTVVGFIDVSYPYGDAALVSPDEPAATASGEVVSTAYFSTTGYASSTELSELMASVLGEDGSWSTNSTLLMYQGLDTSRAMYNSLAMFAGVLAAVIVVAAVSLISNAFTISLSERTRQFGLLSSLGASRRQLRRTVLTEAGLLGLAGIPLGLAVGAAGASVVFALTGEDWATIVGGDAAVRLVVAPADVAVAVVLSVFTLLVSAAAPAVRAGRVSAVDAIRGARDVRPSRRLARAFRRRRAAADDLSSDLRRPRGLAARLGGMPAFLARRTLAVSAGKSRVAAVALAISVALLVTAGLVSSYLSGTMGYLDYTGSMDVELYLMSQDSSPNLADDPTTANQNAIVSDLAQVAGVSRAAGVTGATTSVHVDPAGVNWDGAETFARESTIGPLQVDRAGYGGALVELVDDATWRTLARELDLGEKDADPAALSCVALNALDVTNSETYGSVSPFTGTAAELELVAPVGGEKDFQWFMLNEDGTWGLNTIDPETSEDVSFEPAAEMDLARVSVPVAAYADDLGDSFPVGLRSLATNRLVLVMPMRAVLASDATGMMMGSMISYYANFAEGADEDEVMGGLEKAVAARDDVELGGATNLAEAGRQVRATEYTVNVFLYSFIAITMAIAVANVFNTIASGLMLRTREFAVLQSAGMGRRAFRRMIVLECADFAVKGLVGGVALATLVNVGLFSALSGSISTLVFSMPWGHVVLACAVVVAALVASVAYALRKTHAMNLVEALRAETL